MKKAVPKVIPLYLRVKGHILIEENSALTVLLDTRAILAKEPGNFFHTTTSQNKL